MVVVLSTPEDPAALADAARWFMALPSQQLEVFGGKNRAYAEAHFDQRKILAEHEEFMLGPRPCVGESVS